jgi:hypothetical protein
LNGGYCIHHSRAIGVRVQATSHSRAQLGDAYTLLFDMNAFAEENTRRPLDLHVEFSAGEGI